jgi:hypothetical protein
MDEPQVRERAEAFCAALQTGDIEEVTRDFSKEIRQNLGEVLVLLPLPSTEATVVGIERGGSSFTVVVHLVGETEEVDIQTRWKDRDGQPTLIELSHLSSTERAVEAGEIDGEGADSGEPASA